jgi:catechol 2,3-dioxygenase-like lactoylglutathione lyase family enzyme
MDQGDFPAPADGFLITHFLVVSDQSLRRLVGEGRHLPHRAEGSRREIRAYIRDPDGHLIEVGQATGILG